MRWRVANSDAAEWTHARRLPMCRPAGPFKLLMFVAGFIDGESSGGPSPSVCKFPVVQKLDLHAVFGVIQQFRIYCAMVLGEAPEALSGPGRARLADVTRGVETARRPSFDS